MNVATVFCEWGICSYIYPITQFQPLVAPNSERRRRIRKSFLPVHSLSLDNRLVYLHEVYACICWYNAVIGHLSVPG